MLSSEQSELLTRVSGDVPMGRLFRQYWHAFAAESDMRDRWTMRVRLLGEDLVLFKDRQGRLGLIAEQCPHRRASLAYGIPTDEGIRCCYHGWMMDKEGRCLDQPNEDRAPLKGKVITKAYPVQSLGGVLFTYMGPQPAPLLPKFDAFVQPRAIRCLGKAVIPTNWLQIMENSLDPVHTEWLHGKLYEFMKEGEGVKTAISRHHVKIAFDEFEYGIVKRRLLEGQSEDADDWRIGHPIIFPNQLSVGNGSEETRSYAFQIRVPMDDFQTLHLWYTAYLPPADAKVPPHLYESVHTYDVPIKDDKGEYIVDNVDGQDIMVWITQGVIADREKERLGASDKGIVQYRRMLKREIEKLEQGIDPIGVIRDSNKNGIIELPIEKERNHFSESFANLVHRTHIRYAPVADDLIRIFDRKHA
ncbi:MAG: Rieske 2Fe-2S domain-containing protein [Xanthobacteraceae bacterium]